jgi:hypothetical protein
MNFFFSSPLMLSAFSAVPALVAIYLLRNRFRTQVVSSLILWIDQRRARQGGLQISRIQTPLLLLIELLIIIMLVLAAAGPLIRAGSETRVFVIVLDDSFSMLAGDETTARQRAEDAVLRLLKESGRFNARFIIAGKQAQLLGTPARTVSQAAELLGQWKCLSGTAEIGQAVALAAELAGRTARILVVSDHNPEVDFEQGRLEWRSFGKQLANVAFVNASRTIADDKERCLLTVANLSDKSARTTLTILSLDKSQKLLEKSLELGVGGEVRVFFEPQANAGALRAVLEDDALHIDNEVILLPEPDRAVRLQVNIKNEALASAVKRAVDATKLAMQSSIAPDILIADSAGPDFTSVRGWTLRIVSEPNAASYIGPFVLDRTHPLTEGLWLKDIIWTAAESREYTGSVIISAGNVSLLTDRVLPSGTHIITMHLVPELSNLTLSANWPVLFWNLMKWRKASLPGIIQSNFKLNSTVTFTAESTDNDIVLTDPQNSTKQISVAANTVVVEPEVPGLYRLKVGDKEHLFAVNAVAKSESNLMNSFGGEWGKWQQASVFWWEYRSLDWLLLLGVLILLTAHRFLTAQQQKGAAV